MKNRLPNVHPGEILLQDFLKPLSISQNRLARDIKGESWEGRSTTVYRLRFRGKGEDRAEPSGVRVG